MKTTKNNPETPKDIPVTKGFVLAHDWMGLIKEGVDTKEVELIPVLIFEFCRASVLFGGKNIFYSKNNGATWSQGSFGANRFPISQGLSIINPNCFKSKKAAVKFMDAAIIRLKEEKKKQIKAAKQTLRELTAN